MAKIAYTGDLHLEFAKNKDVSIKDVAGIFCDALAKVECDFAVVAGDTSHCPADVVRFFAEVDKLVTKPVYTVLGNHDYWNWASSIVKNQHEELPNKSVEEIEAWLKKKFAKFNNVKLLVAGDKFTHGDITIIGDCGFSAYNTRFNWRNGIYRGTINSESEERYLTNRWRNFYEQEAFNGGKTLIIAHHPLTDWGYGYDDGDKNRHYIFGHVHDLDARTATSVEIIKKGNYHGDAASGYYAKDITFKTLEIKE
jgi:predicted phosphodiesterase